MKEIDDYINSLYKNSPEHSTEVKELKEEMKTHLVEAIEELKREGKSQSESIKIALDRFGETAMLEDELSEVVPIYKKSVNPILLLSIGALVILFSLIILLISELGSGGLRGTIAVFLLPPTYLIIRCVTLKNQNKSEHKFSITTELYKFIFIYYISLLIGIKLFPIYTYPNFSNPPIFDIGLIPIKWTIQNVTTGLQHGLTLNYILINRIRAIALFIPLGFLAPITYSKFKSLKKSILLGLIAYILISLANIFLTLIGISELKYILISVDMLLINLTGVFLGHLLFSFLNKKHYLTLHKNLIILCSFITITFYFYIFLLRN
ncbi:VanZ family protein [Clostridium sp. 'White wine YQ']|uniref:VanZ family protein n=1 Tax=Clostridium sp. 'White wine YQ' TaxID=3027474 RepID=UPI002365AE59|nr:VanZ family protein [Clostridium sp. 'White wine YQ']MDD7795130.1 VanZ family protein [Clostridium sp. 'White wine YQ']